MSLESSAPRGALRTQNPQLNTHNSRERHQMNNQILFGIAVIPAVIGLVEVCKTLGLPTRAAPALAVAFGVLAALAQLEAGTWPWIQAVVLGVSFGLSASGLYAGVKTTIIPALAGSAGA